MDQAVLEREIEMHLKSQYGIDVQYGCESLELKVEDDPETQWPVCLRFRQANRHRVISAKYAVGADGASSWTRQQAGIEMETSPTDQIWGVADIHPLTNFPDIRSRCIVHTEQTGTMMTIPRESGMVRIYVQLGEESSISVTDASDVVAAAQKIIAPYELTYRHCYWWSQYRIKQGLAERFSASNERILLIGDAVHTHSPKAGMGLNISLQDAFNLGWKLAAVIRGKASPRLLATYEEERRPVADFLVNFDREFLNIFHAPLEDMSVQQYRDTIISATTKEHASLSGVSVSYNKASMFNDPRFNKGHLAPGVAFGARMPSGVVVNHSDGRSRTTHDLLPSSGRWRLVVFPGDIREPRAMRRYTKLGADLQTFLLSHASASVVPDSMLDIITIHSSPRHETELLKLPGVYHPWDDEFGWDYHKVFSDEKTLNDPENTGKVYRKFGISNEGCVVLLRPDQHVCLMSGLEEAAKFCAEFFDRYLGIGGSEVPAVTERNVVRAVL